LGGNKLSPQPSFKEMTIATNSTAFQKLPDEIKRSVLMRLKDNGASLRQLERLTGIGKEHDISHVMKQEPVPVFH